MPVKKVRFHRHAKRRMKEREVTPDEVENALREPDLVKPSVKGRCNAFKFVNGRFVRVTYKEETDHLLVITVVMRKKPFKEPCHED